MERLFQMTGNELVDAMLDLGRKALENAKDLEAAPKCECDSTGCKCDSDPDDFDCYDKKHYFHGDGTLIPKVKRIIFNAKTTKQTAARDGEGNLIIDEATGKPKRETVQLTKPIYTTTVFFSDGSKSTVKLASTDTYNKEHGVIYAIMKRLYGFVNEFGETEGDGVSIWLTKMVKDAWDQPTEEERIKKEKAEAREKHLAKQKAEQEAAHKRKIERLARELKNWQEAKDFLAAQGMNVSQQLINEVAASTKCAREVQVM